MSKNKTIILSSNTMWSVWNFRLNLIQALLERGFDVCVVAPRERSERGYAQRLADIDGVSVHDIYMHRTGTNPVQDIRTLLSYAKTIRKIRPYAVLNFTVKPNIYATLASRIVCPSAKILNNISGLGSAFISGGWKEKLVTFLYRASQRCADHVFFQNKDDQQLFISKRLITKEKTEVLPGSGVDLERFVYSAPKQKESVTFLYIGRIAKEKGILEYLEAISLVSKTQPNARFIFAGATDDDNPSSLSEKEFLARIQDNPNIQYAGTTDDVLPLLQEADCVVLPSHREGMPRSLLEACAAGRAIITTDVPGCRSVVENDVNGYMVPVNDMRALSSAMLKMIEVGFGARRSMGEAARKKVEREFDEQNVIDAYVHALAD